MINKPKSDQLEHFTELLLFFVTWKKRNILSISPMIELCHKWHTAVMAMFPSIEKKKNKTKNTKPGKKINPDSKSDVKLLNQELDTGRKSHHHWRTWFSWLVLQSCNIVS